MHNTSKKLKAALANAEYTEETSGLYRRLKVTSRANRKIARGVILPTHSSSGIAVDVKLPTIIPKNIDEIA